jgi:galactoside 2-L-fucosyltransferase 1/2
MRVIGNAILARMLVCAAAMAALGVAYYWMALAREKGGDSAAPPLWVSASPAGRLGNQLFTAAVVHGIAARRGALVCLDFAEWADKEIFRAVVWPVRQCPAGARLEDVNDGGMYARYVPEKVVDVCPNRSIKVGGCLQSFRYWSGVVEPPFRLKASRWARQWIQERKIRIGIHARRGDYLTSLGHMGKTPPISYYAAALARLNATSGAVVLVCSDDPDWVETQLLFRGMHVSRGLTPGQDMALLAECDHVIVSAGTFGWWAAYLKHHRPAEGGGKVFYYVNPDNDAATGVFVYGDHFPPAWVPIEIS